MTVHLKYEYDIHNLTPLIVNKMIEITPPCFTPLLKERYCDTYDPHEARDYCPTFYNNSNYVRTNVLL